MTRIEKLSNVLYFTLEYLENAYSNPFLTSLFQTYDRTQITTNLNFVLSVFIALFLDFSITDAGVKTRNGQEITINEIVSFIGISYIAFDTPHIFLYLLVRHRVWLLAEKKASTLPPKKNTKVHTFSGCNPIFLKHVHDRLDLE